MFHKFKHWSQRLLERDGPADSVELRKEPAVERRITRPQSLYNPATTSASVTSRTTPTPSIPRAAQAGGSDPRELPRPAHLGLIVSSNQPAQPVAVTKTAKNIFGYCYMNPLCQGNAESDQDDHYNAGNAAAGCVCTNCRALPLLTECGVCLEPLQGQMVHSCLTCANLTCKSCALKLQKCAFCRAVKRSVPNPALQRLLDRLALPCKNIRSGCTELVDGDSRIAHEAVCRYGTFGCPVGSHICGWHGDLTRIQDHLQKVHDLRPIVDNGIAVEISGFRGKVHASDGRQYTVCLSCHQHLYVIKIVLFQGKLRLSFCQLGSVSNEEEKTTDPARSYGVWIAVNSATKALNGTLPFRKGSCDTREIEITSDSIMPFDETDSATGSVKINILIKPVTVV